ncbi:gas vesicle protein GvpG [Bacillus sp. AFS029533]|uniref:gas vesicle protein GvpG n=1 Tax=Bacillus sp. AFS029533 TaxID=2033494 RepID=UPI000BFB63DB|nr:gas vesicle protein GvpG [Bacillus sp. AFS029533]PGZ92479.1 gas vesicle protein GvpG [Bacillus sp. AFS029533]
MIFKALAFPLKSIILLGEKIKEEADRVLFDSKTIEQQLIRLQMMYELGEISQDIYEQQEEELLLRYQVAKMKEREVGR